MKEMILVSFDNEQSWFLVNPKYVSKGCYFTGEEKIYVMDQYGDLSRLNDTIVYPEDGNKYFVEIESEVEEGEYDLEYDDCYYAEYDIDFDDNILTLEYGINSEEHMISSHNFDIYCDIMRVYVEKVDYIPQIYPFQPYVSIFEGEDENGEKIRIEEEHPFYEDQHYPISTLTYL